MKVVITDGGRSAAGFKGVAADCVCRSISIATEIPYADIYKALADGAASTGRPRSARNGINTRDAWFKSFMGRLGFTWVTTVKFGAPGPRIHLRDGELPAGRLVVDVSKHYTAVIDGVNYDAFDCSRGGTRVVYGYWRLGGSR